MKTFKVYVEYKDNRNRLRVYSGYENSESVQSVKDKIKEILQRFGMNEERIVRFDVYKIERSQDALHDS